MSSENMIMEQRAITDTFGTDPQADIERRASAIRYTLPRTITLANLIGDRNRIHQDIQAAIGAGFEDIPVIGIDLMGTAGRIARELLIVGQELSSDLSYTQLEVTFKHPIYHEESPFHKQPQWHIGKIEYGMGAESRKIVVPFEARTDEEERGLKIKATATLSRDCPSVPRLEKRLLVYRARFLIKEADSNSWNELMGNEVDWIVPTHVAAIVPSVCLQYMDALIALTGEKIFALRNVSMNTAIYDQMQPGMANIDIYEIPGRKGEGVQRFAKRQEFGALISQDDRPIVFTRAKSHTSGNLDTRAWIKTNPNTRELFTPAA